MINRILAFLSVLIFSASSGFAQSSSGTGIYERIVINDAIGPAGSRAFASPFNAVVGLSSGGAYCTGTLIAPNVVLSARHCQAAFGDTVVFGTDLNNEIFEIGIQSVFNPGGNGGGLLSGRDVAIITLTGNVPPSVATPMRLTDLTNELVGMQASLIGYGFNGVGSVGHQNTSDDRRWGGMNVIDRYGTPASASGSNIFSTDFDNGTAAANTIAGSSLTPLQFEATTAPGDSGGPLLVNFNGEWLIAGVLSGGTTATSVYGDISWWTGIGQYRSEIESFGGVFYAVPEPGSLAVLMCLTLVSIRRRGRN